MLNQIVQGGMGVLSGLLILSSIEPIALKFLSKPTALDPASETRFLNEARAAAAWIIQRMHRL